MSNVELSALISRLDFAWVTTFHIIYPPLTIGLAALLFFAEWRWLRTNDETWYRLCRFFEKLFIVNFGAGVATGVTMEMAFGILYGPFSQAAGPFLGQVLGYETITAFMYEAGFIGLMVFGWGKISRGMHLFATFNVALASSLSAFWIMDANSWMQSPSGVEYKDGVFHIVDWYAAILNPDVLAAFPHKLVASFELSLFFAAAVSAWYILKGQHVALFQRSLKYSVLALVVVAPLQVYVGDSLGRVTADAKPAGLAAMEGHFHTYNPDGSPNTSWNVLAWPNAKGDGNAWSIQIPHVLSLLETHTFDQPVPGLDQFAPQDRPPVVIPFYAFRIMAAIGGFLTLVAFWGGWLAWRGRLSVTRVTQNRWFLRAIIFSGFLPYLAIWTGWWTREVSRQPWVVYGLMRTEDGVSNMSVMSAIFWLVGFMTFELIVWAGTWYFLAKVVRKGPDMDSPIPGEGHEQLGHLADNSSNPGGEPEYIRPV
ncbi:cytochrome ubiquinol oxidase subunit I [Rhizobiaceae bacterium n13]|uniref:Cytochrome ubiquinol oxidase subunit I n=1 Tax=Ferirhizobium litorale TaxID=2927786 RepID=A0AAE3QIY3_9HYPH|nr:cytochrome ubiquinol oxidase subunit I [Fererhizobium litorale]MDI7862741.1 cytochrome ubiquinol oxidase subunit I [Fererhizobium litorale]MDI7924395.1 cytochrome ubiquinol oxidase subunit I [Fererhizobium litorale]